MNMKETHILAAELKQKTKIDLLKKCKIILLFVFHNINLYFNKSYIKM